MDKLQEEWRDIAGFEGCYQVSNIGRVRSLTRTILVKLSNGKVYPRISTGRILRQKKDKDGQFSDSDKKCAEKAGFHYMDIEDFIQCDDFLND